MLLQLTSIFRKQDMTPSPHSLIIEPDEPAKVTRLKNGRFHIQWQRNSETVYVYASAHATFAEPQHWATVTGAQEVIVPPLPDTLRPYFILEFGEEDRLFIAERILPVPNSFNFRDIGGYHTENGDQIRWGEIYRAGSLAALNGHDFTYFNALNLRLVCDLRSSLESESYPDRLPDTPDLQYLQRPLSSPGTLMERVKTLHQYRHRIGDLLLLLYQNAFIDENAHHIGDMLTRIADPANRPALIHCSAGKDRTGVTIALLLSILGVPEETIIADYSLSNHAHQRITTVMAPELRQARWVGVGMAKMKPVLLADPTYLRATFSHIRSTYGSVENYLCGAAGMAPETLDRLRAELLM